MPQEAIAAHLQLAVAILPRRARLARERARLRSPLRGDELARELGIAPGPRLGELLEELLEARYAGEHHQPRRGGSVRARAARRARVLADVMRDPDCIFCKIVAGELPARIVDEDERTITFMDIAPATRGHALVIPREHSSDLLEYHRRGPAPRRHRGRPATGRSACGERLGADGVNLLNACGAAAWQTVFHFHLHVIPRYARRSIAPAVDARPPAIRTRSRAAAEELAAA